MSCAARVFYLNESRSSTVAYLVLAGTNILLAIFTIIGNSLILHALRKCQSLRRSTKALFCSLAFSDLSIGVFVLPLFVAYCFAVAFYNVDVFCVIQGPYAIAGFCLASVSFLTMTAICLDRYYAVKLKQRYHQVATFKLVASTLAACWIFGIIWPSTWLLSETLAMITALIIIFCCVVVTSVFSIKTYLGIRQQQQQIHPRQVTSVPTQQHDRNEATITGYRRSLNTMMLIFCLLFACYLPYFTVLGVNMATTSNSYTALAYNISSGIIYFNSLLNPIVYCVKIRQIRREVFILLPCFAN